MNINEVPFISWILGKALDSIYFFQVPRFKYLHRESAPEFYLGKLHQLHAWCTFGCDF